MRDDSSAPRAHGPKRVRNLAILVAIVVVWLMLDQATKAYFNTFEVGNQIGGPYMGLFELTLVHNTGAAWGTFSDMTMLLGFVSIAVCILACVYLFALAPNSSVLSTVGLSLVIAGGIGNAIDRFANGYVIDFINASFIDFPVFNIADIGVTCGVAIFLISLIAEYAREGRKAHREGS